MGAYCKALNGLHNNVLLGQIMISSTRSKRVNENNHNMLHTQPIKSQYMQIFLFVSVSVSIIMQFVLITISNTRSKG